MKIKILVLTDDDALIAEREALSWESAEESLGKLERALRLKSTAEGGDDFGVDHIKQDEETL